MSFYATENILEAYISVLQHSELKMVGHELI